MKIIHFPIIDSTSDYLLKHPEIDDFVPVIANIQTNGRGYRDKKWYSSDRGGLYLSMYLPYSIKMPGFRMLYRVMLFLFPLLRVSWKWPNDIVYKGKKIGGILVEEKKGRGYVVGLGLNLNQKDFEEEINATSIYIEKRQYTPPLPFIYYLTHSIQIGMGSTSLMKFLSPFLVKKISLENGSIAEIIKLNDNGSILICTEKGYDTIYSKERLL